MTHPARLTLAAPRGHALAEALRLAFAARGTDLDLAPLQAEAPFLAEGTPRLTVRRGAEPPVILRDPVALLELAEDLHPDQPLHPHDPIRRAEHRHALAQLPNLASLIDRLTLATDPRDVDLNTHLIRNQLGALAPVLTRPARGPTLLDLATTPILWRLDALDRSFETHLLTGHDALRDRHEAPRWPDILTPDLLADWLGWISAGGALISRPDTQPDWSTAVGPNDRENDVPLRTPRTKVHSIGTRGVLR
jgi:glutathione S-transferase